MCEIQILRKRRAIRQRWLDLYKPRSRSCLYIMSDHNQNSPKNQAKSISSSKKYIDWIKPENQKLQDTIKLATVSKEKVGAGDVSFIEFVEMKPDLKNNQANGNAFLVAQEEAKSALLAQEYLISDEQLLENISNHKVSFVEVAVKRIKIIREIGDPISADILEKKLLDAAKKIGIKPKTINDLFKEKPLPDTTKEQKEHEFPFEILGFNKERKILFWHRGHQMHIPILSLKHELQLFIGPTNVSDDMVTEIISMAHEKNIIDEEEPIKVGIWQFREWRKEGKILILSGRSGIFFKDGKYTQLEGPVVRDQIVNFEKRPWIDLDALKTTKPNLKQTFNEVKEILAQWPWKEQDMANWMTALVMLLPFQQLMRWRPWIWLEGASNSGKSAFFEEFLDQLYRSLLKRADKATAHSIAQGVGCTSKIPILGFFVQPPIW